MIRKTYNEKNKLLEQIYCDSSGNTVNSSDGYSTVAYVYDDLGRQISMGYFNKDGARVNLKAGWSYKLTDYGPGGTATDTMYTAAGDVVPAK